MDIAPDATDCNQGKRKTQSTAPSWYFEDEPNRRAVARLLTRDEARRIAVNIAAPPGLSFGCRSLGKAFHWQVTRVTQATSIRRLAVFRLSHQAPPESRITSDSCDPEVSESALRRDERVPACPAKRAKSGTMTCERYWRGSRIVGFYSHPANGVTSSR
jgi:hypothetical protein